MSMLKTIRLCGAASTAVALALLFAPPARAETQYSGYDAPPPLPADWRAELARRDKALADYIKQKEVAYFWFSNFPFGLSSGAPFLMLQLMPRFAPDLWSGKDNFLEDVGLFNDARNPGYPIAHGYGWTGLARQDANAAPDFATISCGACHIGRVKLDDGSIRYIDGGVNTQFNLVKMRLRIAETLKRLMGDAATDEEKVKRVTLATLAKIDEVHAENKNFFYHNYVVGGRSFDAAYEANQIELFKKQAPIIVAQYLVRAELDVVSLQALLAKNYQGFEGPMLQGFGGMADATGVSESFLFAAAGFEAKRTGQLASPLPTPETSLPPGPAITDFMAVWEQNKRRAHWSADHTQLIDGGGQWNGNIPIPVYRNLAAELTVGLLGDTDVRVADLAADLLQDLPASPYPFDVDLARAKRGQALYEENCAGCHHPHNGKVYDLGTDLGRARVVSPMIAKGARDGFAAVCPPTKLLLLPPDKRLSAPCAEFDGVSLTDKSTVLMADPKDHLGYNALPLGGVWAQAPYLHNGSVPTLYHLLVPSERPAVFMKGRLGYDKSWVGFSWDANQPPTPEDGYRFDTSAFVALSNKGHDKNGSESGKAYRLDWSDDKEGALAIIEYMKTF